MTLDLTIAAIRDETDRIRVLELKAADAGTLPAYTPGAHLQFETPAGARSFDARVRAAARYSRSSLAALSLSKEVARPSSSRWSASSR